MEEGGAQGVI